MILRIQTKTPGAPQDSDWDVWTKRLEAAVAEAGAQVVDGELYFLCRHGSYFRPHAQGYTDDPASAGLFTAQVARNYLDIEGLSVVPLSAMRETLEERLKRAEAQLVLLRVLIDTPNLAVSDLT